MTIFPELHSECPQVVNRVLRAIRQNELDKPLDFNEIMMLKLSNRNRLLIGLSDTLAALEAQGPEAQQEWLDRQKQALMTGCVKKRPERFLARTADVLSRE